MDIKVVFSVIKGPLAVGQMHIAGIAPIPIQSGPWGNGHAPLGEYATGRLWSPDEIQLLPNGASYTKFDVGFFLLLIPKFKTTRSGIGIHPMRGNGTLGCCGIIGKDANYYKILYNKLSELISAINFSSSPFKVLI